MILKYETLNLNLFRVSNYNNCLHEMLKEKIREKELVNKLDSSEFIHNSDLDKKINNTSRKRRIKSRGKK